MQKKLSEMSIEELWQLFPISLTEHKACWKDWYAKEATLLKSFLMETVQINHIGSTAICSIWAKPIIDILVEVPRDCNLLQTKNLLENNGYICMNQQVDRISFNKGYTKHGFADRVFHLHLRYMGDHDELYFRDYLMAHPPIAKQYEEMKLKLWKKYEHNRDKYTEEKTDFIQTYTRKAKSIYGNR